MFSKLPSENPLLTLFLSDDGGFVYSSVMQSAQSLNPCSMLIWLLIESGHSDQFIYDHPQLQPLPQSDFAKVLRQLRQYFESGSWSDNATVNSIDAWLVDAGLAVQHEQEKEALNLMGLNIHFSLCEQQLFSIEHLFGNYTQVLTKTYCNISILQDSDLFQISINNHCCPYKLQHNEIIPQLIMLIRRMIKLSGSWLGAAHSGIADVYSKRVIFPGISGAGKSTLLAALMSSGTHVYSDEQTLFDSNGAVVGLSTVIGIKEGSWPIISQLSDSELIHYRLDGVAVKYLPLRNLCTHKLLDLIIFPKYAKGESGKIVKLSHFDAVQYLFASGFEFCQAYSLEAFEQLLNVVQQADCYELSYSDVSKAASQVSRLCKDS